MNMGLILRNLVTESQLLVVPGIYDALTAKIAQYCGFPVIYMTGYGTSASYGYPDIGLLTMSEIVENVRRICEVSEKPLIADADTGYGNTINVYRTVREFEKAGAAGIQLEDQTWPKRCGHMIGKKIIKTEEMINKIKAAADARINPDTVLVVRTDAIAVNGLEEAIYRGEMYSDAGADIIFIEAPQKEQMREIPSHFKKPCMLNIPFPKQGITLKIVKEMGYKIALYPLAALYGTLGGCLRVFEKLIDEGEIDDLNIPFNFEQINKLLGLDKFRAIEEKSNM